MAIKYWVGVASKKHVQIGVDGGFCQLNHGKRQALDRMSEGDYIIYYSPKLALESQVPYQKFVAVGKIISKTYQGNMGDNFMPFRRDVSYYKAINEVPLSSINQDPGWIQVRSKLRYGHLEVPEVLFKKIIGLMKITI